MSYRGKCWEMLKLLPWGVTVGVESLGNMSWDVETMGQLLSCIAG